jgi:hypothetical protein
MSQGFKTIKIESKIFCFVTLCSLTEHIVTIFRIEDNTEKGTSNKQADSYGTSVDFIELHDVTTQKTVRFIVSALITGIQQDI